MASAKCPVCGWGVGDDARDVHVDGETARVCCEECAEKLMADPAAYAKE